MIRISRALTNCSVPPFRLTVVLREASRPPSLAFGCFVKFVAVYTCPTRSNETQLHPFHRRPEVRCSLGIQKWLTHLAFLHRGGDKMSSLLTGRVGHNNERATSHKTLKDCETTTAWLLIRSTMSHVLRGGTMRRLREGNRRYEIEVERSKRRNALEADIHRSDMA